MKQYKTDEIGKMVVKLGEMLSSSHFEDPISEDIKEMRVFDPANILSVEAKTMIAKRVLRFFIEKDSDIPTKPTWKGEQKDGTRIAVEYITKVFEFFKIAYEDEGVNIEILKDCPIKISNDEWEFIISPRIDS